MTITPTDIPLSGEGGEEQVPPIGEQGQQPDGQPFDGMGDALDGDAAELRTDSVSEQPPDDSAEEIVVSPSNRRMSRRGFLGAGAAIVGLTVIFGPKVVDSFSQPSEPIAPTDGSDTDNSPTDTSDTAKDTLPQMEEWDGTKEDLWEVAPGDANRNFFLDPYAPNSFDAEQVTKRNFVRSFDHIVLGLLYQDKLGKDPNEYATFFASSDVANQAREFFGDGEGTHSGAYIRGFNENVETKGEDPNGLEKLMLDVVPPPGKEGAVQIGLFDPKNGERYKPAWATFGYSNKGHYVLTGIFDHDPTDEDFLSTPPLE